MDTKADWLFLEDRHFLASPHTDLKKNNNKQTNSGGGRKIRTWK